MLRLITVNATNVLIMMKVLTSVDAKEIELAIADMHRVSRELPVVILVVVGISKVAIVSIVTRIAIVTIVEWLLIWVVGSNNSHEAK